MTRIVNSERSVFGYAAYNIKEDMIILAFRGTNGADLDNWITGIRYAKTPYPGVPKADVHRGFYEAYRLIQDKVRSTMAELIGYHNTSRILITGHSLGGALAVHAAVDIKTILPEITTGKQIYLYTFGQPRVGDKEFSEYIFSLYPNTYKRVVHADDMVAHLPSKSNDFRHAGNEVWYKKSKWDGKWKECENTPGSAENTGCSQSLWFKWGIDTHVSYFGFRVGGICAKAQPRNSL